MFWHPFVMKTSKATIPKSLIIEWMICLVPSKCTNIQKHRNSSLEILENGYWHIQPTRNSSNSRRSLSNAKPCKKNAEMTFGGADCPPLSPWSPLQYPNRNRASFGIGTKENFLPCFRVKFLRSKRTLKSGPMCPYASLLCTQHKRDNGTSEAVMQRECNQIIV
jgi:hypothetical protein